MKIAVDRFTSDGDTTLSEVSIDGAFVCFGLEDEFRTIKVADETRIPAGTYTVGLRVAGKHHQQYKQRFPDLHRGMLHILDVPGFEYVLIHCGNTHADTSGCLLVGTGAIAEPGKMSISRSVAAYRRLYPMVVDAAAAGRVKIELIDHDR
jgi:hypothetical protein